MCWGRRVVVVVLEGGSVVVRYVLEIGGMDDRMDLLLGWVRMGYYIAEKAATGLQGGRTAARRVDDGKRKG